MAYSYTVTAPVYDHNSGVDTVQWTVTETEAAASSEWEIAIPTKLQARPLTMTLLYGRITAGSATTMQTKIGTATNPTAGAAGYLDQIATAAAAVRAPENLRIPFGATVIYGRSTVDTGSDNTVITDVIVALGHRP